MQSSSTAPSKQGRAVTSDGTAIAYALRSSGNPNAPRIVLVHSLALDRSIWDGVVAALGDGVDVLTYDCRGHGASDKPAGPYTTELFARDLHDLLGSVGWKSAVVGGASMGGSVTLQFAISYPKMLDGLGLFDTTAWYGADAPKSWRERAEKAQADGLAGLIAFQQTRWFSDAYRTSHTDVTEHFEHVFKRNDVAAYAATCDMLGNFDLRGGLASIAVPTEILVGDEDYATPPDMARALNEGIAGSNLTVVAGARHLTPIEIPDRIAALLKVVVGRKASHANGR